MYAVIYVCDVLSIFACTHKLTHRQTSTHTHALKHKHTPNTNAPMYVCTNVLVSDFWHKNNRFEEEVSHYCNVSIQVIIMLSIAKE